MAGKVLGRGQLIELGALSLQQMSSSVAGAGRSKANPDPGSSATFGGATVLYVALGGSLREAWRVSGLVYSLQFSGGFAGHV